MQKLTPMQNRFAQNIADGHNITQSAIKAGYSEKSAYNTGSQNMKKSHILDRIKEIQDEEVDEVRRRFTATAKKAMKALIEVLEDPDTPAQTRTHTAKTLLDYAGFKPDDNHNIHADSEFSVKVEWSDSNE